jgi:hypothetical protein
VVGGGAVPVPLPRGRVDGLAGAELDDLAAAGLGQPGPVGDVEGLPEGVGVPGGAAPARAYLGNRGIEAVAA